MQFGLDAQVNPISTEPNPAFKSDSNYFIFILHLLTKKSIMKPAVNCDDLSCGFAEPISNQQKIGLRLVRW